MSDITSNTPPFTPQPPTPTADPLHESWTDQRPALFVAASIGLGLIAAGVVGTLIGMLVYSGFAADCHNDGWCELGAALLGLLAGCLAGGVAHIVAGVMFIRRHRPQGRRTVPIMVHIGMPVMLYGFLLAISSI